MHIVPELRHTKPPFPAFGAFESERGVRRQDLADLFRSAVFFKLQKLFGDISVSINNVRYRNDQEYQFFASPIKLFDLKYYDFNWMNELRKWDENATAISLIDRYRKSDTTIKAGILNVSSFDRGEASNMISFYKQMLVSTRTLQMNDYIITNHKLLQELRQNYNLK